MQNPGAAFCASFIPIVYFFFPETGGLSLEQIDHIFEGKGQGWSGLTQGVRESAHRSLRRDPIDYEASEGISGWRSAGVLMGEKNDLPSTTQCEDVGEKVPSNAA